MYLKRIELFGFKSFADKTAVEFLPGVTCIVGPNGCGKSNISDAIRWVLGERSAKQLRGSKMEDVIFSGTSFRKPLGMAEVSLVIDNRDKVLSIGYEEVVLTRRLFRSGESEYLINKTPCRYKDIQDLLMDTGIGSHSYSMIEQGRIDYILQAEPEERRFLIEEAAGISHFKSQKEEAIRKLERTENNLLRLTDIVSEVEKNIKYAERQAKRAEKYREYYETLKQKETQKTLLEKKRLTRELEELGGRLSHNESHERNTAQRVETLKNLFSELERTEEEKLQELRFKEGKRFELKSEIQNRESAKAFNFEKIGEIRNQIENLEKEIQTLIQSTDQMLSKSEEAKLEFSSIKEKHDSFEKNYEIFIAKANELESALQSFEHQETELRNLIFERAGESAALRNEIHRLELRRTSLEISTKKTDEQFVVGKSELTQYEERYRHLESESTGKESELNRLHLEREELLSKIKNLKEQLTQVSSEKEELVSKRQNIESSIRVFEELEIALLAEEGLDKTTLSELENSCSVKTLYQTLSIEPGYEKAVEKALGLLLRALTLTDPAYLEILESKLRDKAFSEIPVFFKDTLETPFIPVNWLEGECPEYLIPFSKIVKTTTEQEWIVPFLFGDTFYTERNLTYPEYFELLRKCPGISIVHSSGKVWGPGQQVMLRGSKEEVSFLEKKKEWERLSIELDSLQELVHERVDSLETLQNQILEIENTVSRLEEPIRTLEVSREVAKREREEITGLLQKVQKECDLYEAEKRQAETEIDSLKNYLETHKNRLEALSHEEKSASERTDQVQEKLRVLRRETETMIAERSRKDQEKSTLAERLQFLQNRLQEFESEIKLEKEKKDRYEQKIIESRERSQDIRFQNEKLEEELKGFRDILRQDELQIHHLEEERLQIQDRKKKVSDDLDQAEKSLENCRSKIYEDRMKIQEFEYSLKSLEERLLQAYKIQVSDISLTPEEETSLDLTQLEDEIQSLKQRLTDVGTVNLLAVEEYEELKRRFDFLDAQNKDLIKAREELMEAIRKINRTTKRIFEETYEKVRINFEEFFKILFGGGEAKLVMLDEANPLDSGIDIFVRPPGKKNQNISLLSGGEKALTAIALLFALFKIKPSPFSVLDEIDAPLDEANIDRFLDVLRTFLTLSQFIIVTHNRKTIAMGHSLYGVTMQEAGISKVVSVKLQEDGPKKGSVTEQALSANISVS